MSQIIEYKEFRAKVEYSSDDEVFVGRLIDIDDIVIFDAPTVAELKDEMKEAVEFHIDVSQRMAETID